MTTRTMENWQPKVDEEYHFLSHRLFFWLLNCNSTFSPIANLVFSFSPFSISSSFLLLFSFIVYTHTYTVNCSYQMRNSNKTNSNKLSRLNSRLTFKPNCSINRNDYSKRYVVCRSDCVHVCVCEQRNHKITMPKIDQVTQAKQQNKSKNSANIDRHKEKYYKMKINIKLRINNTVLCVSNERHSVVSIRLSLKPTEKENTLLLLSYYNGIICAFWCAQ